MVHMSFEMQKMTFTEVVKFGDPSDKDILAAHTDTVQALILVASQHPSLGVFARGRASEGQSDKISQDPLIKAYVAERAGRNGEANAYIASSLGRLSVEMSSEGSTYSSKFLSLNKIVDDVFDGKTNANKLMTNFGGLTEIEIGSKTCSQENLSRFGRLLRWEVRNRQLGEIPDSVLHKRMREQMIVPSRLVIPVSTLDY